MVAPRSPRSGAHRRRPSARRRRAGGRPRRAPRRPEHAARDGRRAGGVAAAGSRARSPSRASTPATPRTTATSRASWPRAAPPGGGSSGRARPGSPARCSRRCPRAPPPRRRAPPRPPRPGARSWPWWAASPRPPPPSSGRCWRGRAPWAPGRPAALAGAPAATAARAAEAASAALARGDDAIVHSRRRTAARPRAGPRSRRAALAAPRRAAAGRWTGGDTARAVVRGAGASVLHLHGEVEPGVPLRPHGRRAGPSRRHEGRRLRRPCHARGVPPPSAPRRGSLMPPAIAITVGDPAGIGPEIIVKALRHEEVERALRPGRGRRRRAACARPRRSSAPTSRCGRSSDPGEASAGAARIDCVDIAVLDARSPVGRGVAAGAARPPTGRSCAPSS